MQTILRHLTPSFINHGVFNFKLFRTHQIFKVENVLKCMSTNISFTFKSNYTKEEEAKILQVLNECNKELLGGYVKMI